jgi:hypothetical protein
MIDPVEQEKYIARGELIASLVERGLITDGDVITHTRCGGYIEEHVFCGLKSGRELNEAQPTKDTKKFGGYAANDISPRNVTHVNRMPVEMLELTYKNLDRPYASK